MTSQLLQKVIQKIENLPEEKQNIILQSWLNELEETQQQSRELSSKNNAQNNEQKDECLSFLDTAQSLNLEGNSDWSANIDKYLYGEL